MAIGRANDARAFRDFLDAKLSDGGESHSLEELLAVWEYENSSEEEREETLRAIQCGLEDMYAGRTTDAFEFIEQMRRRIRAAAKR